MQYETIYIGIDSIHFLTYKVVKVKTTGKQITKFRITVVSGKGGSKKF